MRFWCVRNAVRVVLAWLAGLTGLVGLAGLDPKWGDSDLGKNVLKDDGFMMGVDHKKSGAILR